MKGAEARHEALYRALLSDLEQRYPGVRIIRKSDSRLCTWIDRALRVLTGGGQAHFLDQFVTTLGRRIYVPDSWDAMPAGRRYCILRHEAVHVQQFRRYTWPGMVLLYLFLPLPVVFAGGRAWLEWQAYRESVVATWQIYGEERARSAGEIDHIVGRFTGPDYAWMWVHGRTIRSAIHRTLDRLAASPPATLPDPEA